MIKIVTKYELIDKQSWSKFVRNHAQGNVFQTPEMYEVYQCAEKIQPYVVAVICDGEVIGVLVGQWMANGGKLGAWLTSRSIVMGGPLVKDNNTEVVDLLINLVLHLYFKFMLAKFFANI